jgi:hypothetical protein
MASANELVLELDDDDEEDVLVVKGRVVCVKLGDLVGFTLPFRFDVAPSDTSVFPVLTIP